MIEILTTPEIIAEAKEKAIELGILPKSMTKGKKNTIGLLGELVVASYFNVPLTSTYNYDLILNGHTVDVKSQEIKNPPSNDYLWAFPEINNEQSCDYYCFTFVKSDLSRIWIAGFYEKDLYYKHATLEPAGTLMTNGKRYEKNNYILQVWCIINKKNELNNLLYRR